MKINFRNEAARLQYHSDGYSCKRCPFFRIINTCPRNTSTIVDCYDKGYWVNGESPDIFKV